MGCIIAASGARTLCNKKCEVMDVLEFFGATLKRVTCPQCLIRQDAMFERGYEQKEYVVWYTRNGTWLSYLKEEFNKYGYSFISVPRKSFRTSMLMWDSKQVRGAIKLGKLGIHGMGIAK